MNHRAFIIIAIVLIGAVVVPQAVHANGATDILLGKVKNAGVAALGGTVEKILSFIADALSAFQGILKNAIHGMGRILQALLETRLSTGGPAVYQVWKIIRDTSNMMFLVILILIAFGTIFNVVWHNPFHWRGAIGGLIIAAITINFSLAFGQLIVGVGDMLTISVLGLMRGQNIGVTVAALADLPSLETGSGGAPSPLILPAASGTPLDQLTDVQKIIVGGWVREGTAGSPVQGAALAALTDCLINKRAPTVDKCYQNSVIVFGNEIAQPLTSDTVAANRNLSSFTQYAAYYKAMFSNNTTERVGGIANMLLTTFMLFVLMLSFLVIIVFSLVRIPAIWLLLALSAGAFVGIALPNSDVFKKWFRNLVGWSIFSPMYLFNIYIGMYVLKQQNNLLASIAQSSSGPSFIANAAFGQILFFFISCFIFIGGAAWCFKVSHNLGSGAGKLFERVGGVFGVSEKTKFGISTVSRKLGIAPAYQAGKERLVQERGRAAAALRGRFGILTPQEEALARARGRFGVTGGAAEYEKAVRQRIEAQQKTIEAPYKERLQALENQLNQARTAEERISLQSQIKQFKDQNTSRLRGLLTSGNRDLALAAGEALLDDDKLSADEIRQVQQRYAQVSPTALASFTKRRNEKLIKNAPKHKFKDAAELQSYLTIIGDPKEAKKYYDAAKGGKSKMLALEAGAAMKIEEKPNGEAYTFAELAQREAPKLSNDDWLATEDFFENRAEKARTTNGNPAWSSLDEMSQISPALRDRLARRALNPKAREHLLINAKPGKDGKPGQIDRIGTLIEYAQQHRRELKRQEQEEKAFSNEPEKTEGGEMKEEKKEEREEKTPKEEKK